MSFKFRTAAIAVAGALILSGLALAAPAVADVDHSCPSPTGKQTSDLVGASYSGTTTVTYLFDSFGDQSPVDGVPGLIRYCVYPGTAPDADPTVSAVGDNGAAWGDAPPTPNFSFDRPDGNPSNIGLDGRSDYAMGTATWADGAPTDQTILLHINDAAECAALYPNGDPDVVDPTLSGTCWVFPGSNTIPPAEALTINKGAAGSYHNTFAWEITKDVDKTTVKQVGGSATFNYTITVTHDSGTVSNVTVSGDITVTNPNTANVQIDGVSDALSPGNLPCDVPDGGSQSLPHGDTVFSYSCDLGDTLPTGAITNTATVTWSDQDITDGHLAGSSASVTTPAIVFTGSDISECTAVSDSFKGSLGTVCVVDANPTTFTYSRTIAVTPGCHSYDNTATSTPTDNGAVDTASQTVTVCGPAQTGALTIGFWKTTNGQSLIKNYCQNPALANYLKGLGAGSGPFSNAPTTSCNDLATYVNSILSGASASNMNNMLKAQMLGTALDVWFSGPGWTSTKSGSAKPPSNFLQHNSLGTFNMDTTAVCPMVDNTSTGTATCKNNLPSTNAVTSGAVPASPMAMQAILDFAATTTNATFNGPFNGSTSSSNWYASNKTKEEILKNIFDQFNNQDAFGSF